jgi:hypothetical protein
MKSWTLKELKIMREGISTTSDTQFAELFNTTVRKVRAARKRHGILRDKSEWNWQKGNKPFNKGLKQADWMTPEGQERIKATQFKAGQAVKPIRPIGTVFSIPDATGKAYMFIKLKHHRQYPYGRYVYEQTHGVKVTKDEVIRFKDGNTQNCDPANLQKVTRGENIRMNSNREKASAALKLTWGVVKTYEDYGITPPYKFRSKRA